MRILKKTKTRKWNNFTSLTAIVVTALNVWFLKKFVKSPFQSEKIACLAYTGFMEDRYYFEMDDLIEAEINLQNWSTFFMSYSKFRLLDGTETTSYFAHLIWQEFFVAVKLRLYTNIRDFKQLLSKLDSDKYEVVTRMLFGLCSDDTLRKLLKNIDKKSLNLELDRKECKEMLKNFAIKKLKQSQNNFSDYFNDILLLLSWIYELGEDNFTKKAAACLKEEISIVMQEEHHTFIPSFNFLLRSRENCLNLVVRINSTFLMKSFLEETNETLEQNSNIKVSVIKLLDAIQLQSFYSQANFLMIRFRLRNCTGFPLTL